MLLQELHIYSEQSSSNTKVSFHQNKDGEILLNIAIPMTQFQLLTLLNSLDYP